MILVTLLESILTFFIPASWKRVKDLNGKVVLITGGGNGIGQFMAIRLVRLGAKVVLWDVNEAGMERTKRMIQEEGLDVDKCWCYKVSQGDTVKSNHELCFPSRRSM